VPRTLPSLGSMCTFWRRNAGLSDQITMRGGAPCEGLAPDLAAMRRRKTMENKVVFILT
jgi:hypothetical protein